MKPAPKFLDKLDRYWQPINKNQKAMKFKYCKKCFTMTPHKHEICQICKN